MSWSVNAVGRGSALDVEIARQFDAIFPSCPEEEAIIQSARSAVCSAVSTMSDGADVSARGYVSFTEHIDDRATQRRAFHNATLQITITGRTVVT